ncbi:MAG: 2-hydroxychromene-2-carboxylate isomerase [Pseudomonadota bacterium]
MVKTVEFLFDVVSPASYFAWHVVPKIAAAAGAELVYTPVLLGGVMQATGNRPPGTVDAKARWMAQDLQRWAALYGLAYTRNAIFPQKTITVMRGMVALHGTPAFHTLGDALFRAMHVENREIQDPQVLAEILTGIGIDAEAFMAEASDQAVKDRLTANTEDAVARGMFGAPTFFVGDQMHFGQDRMWMVAEDLGTSIHAAMGEGT